MPRTPPHVIEVTLPSQLGYEKVVRALIASLARGLGFAAERVADMQTAVSEACINAIEHGNQSRADLKITVTCRVLASRLEVVVRDHGVRAYPLPTPRPATIDQKVQGHAQPRGMGLMLIHELTDESGFLPAQRGGGNRFRMIIRRQRGRARPRRRTTAH